MNPFAKKLPGNKKLAPINQPVADVKRTTSIIKDDYGLDNDEIDESIEDNIYNSDFEESNDDEFNF